MRSLGRDHPPSSFGFWWKDQQLAVIAWLFGLRFATLSGTRSVQRLNWRFSATIDSEVAIQGLIGIIALAGIASVWPSIAAAGKPYPTFCVTGKKVQKRGQQSRPLSQVYLSEMLTRWVAG